MMTFTDALIYCGILVGLGAVGVTVNLWLARKDRRR